MEKQQWPCADSYQRRGGADRRNRKRGTVKSKVLRTVRSRVCDHRWLRWTVWRLKYWIGHSRGR